MKKFKSSTVYVSAWARLPKEMPASKVYEVLDIGLVVDKESKEIQGCSVTLLTGAAKIFIEDILLGSSFDEEGLRSILLEIENRYHGSAQKALQVAIKSCFEKLLTVLEKEVKT